MPEFRRALKRSRPAHVASAEMGSRAVVLMSGGLDSTVVLWWALQRYATVVPVLVDWGQSTPPEQKAARTVARLAGTPLRVVRLSTPDLKLTPGDFTRGHNFSLIGAAGLHVGRGQGDILIGSVRTDGHADATHRFMDDATSGLAGPKGSGAVRVLAPLLELDGKPGVLRTGLEVGAPVSRTWSCNRVRRRAPCERCVSCRDRAKAWATVEHDLLSDRGLTPGDIAAWNDALASWAHVTPAEPTGLIAEEMPAVLRHTKQAPWLTGWTYTAPDRTTRFVQAINPPESFRRRHRWEPQEYLRVTSGSSEMILFPDGRVGFQRGRDQELIARLAEIIVTHPRRPTR